MARRLVNLILPAAIAAAAAVLLLSGGDGDKRDVRISPRDPDSIVHITIRRQDGEMIVLQRVDGTWGMQAPLTGVVNTARISAMLGLLDAGGHPRLPASANDASALGLEPPGVILTLDDLEFRFGAKSPMDGRRYLQYGDTIHLVPDTLYPQLTQPPGFFLRAAE